MIESHFAAQQFECLKIKQKSISKSIEHNFGWIQRVIVITYDLAMVGGHFFAGVWQETHHTRIADFFKRREESNVDASIMSKFEALVTADNWRNKKELFNVFLFISLNGGFHPPVLRLLTDFPAFTYIKLDRNLLVVVHLKFHIT